MRFLPGRVSPAESVTAVCVLVALVLAAGAVIATGLRPGTPNTQPARPAVSEAMASPESSIPAPDGFRAASAAETYGPETLYEKIDGKADMYLEAGFRSLLCQRFVSVKDDGLWLEVFIYDMGTPVNAFGVYGQQKRSGVTDLDITPFAYKTVDGVYLASGANYIEMHGSAATEELSAAMLSVAKSLAGAGQTDSGLAGAMALFPRDGQVAGSSSLYPVDAFGCAALTNVYTVQYNVDGKAVMAFISPRESTEAAAKLAEEYAGFILENGGKEAAMPSGSAGRIFSLYGTTEIVFARGSIVAGVHAADDMTAAAAVAERLWSHLPDKPMPELVPASQPQPASGEYDSDEQ